MPWGVDIIPGWNVGQGLQGVFNTLTNTRPMTQSEIQSTPTYGMDVQGSGHSVGNDPAPSAATGGGGGGYSYVDQAQQQRISLISALPGQLGTIFNYST